METILALFFGLFLISFLIQAAKFIAVLFFQIFKIIFAAVVVYSIIHSFGSMNIGNHENIGEVCSRIDGCPVIDGVCIGCN